MKQQVTETSEFFTEPRLELQYAVIQTDTFGQSIYLFGTKKKAYEYLKRLKEL